MPQELGLSRAERMDAMIYDNNLLMFGGLLQDYQTVTIAVDAFARSVAPLLFIVVLFSIPIQCFSLYIASYLKSSPELRAVAFMCLILIGLMWIFIFFGAATLNHKVLTQSLSLSFSLSEWNALTFQADAPYKTLNSIACRLTCQQSLIKLQAMNLLELIGSEMIGIYCLDLFEFTYDFCLTVSPMTFRSMLQYILPNDT